MADPSKLPPQARRVYDALDGKDLKTAMTLVEELGMSETSIGRWLRKLEDSGWVTNGLVPSGSPSGSAAVGYRKA